MVELAPDITLVIAFAAGFLSFVSPCVLPLVPSYLIYITGLTLEELTSQADRSRVRATIVWNSLFFVLGLSAVFVAFGASASLIGQLLLTYQDFLRKAGGVLIMIFGLYVMGVLKLNFLMTEKRIRLQNRPAGHIGSLLVGMAFAAGWTPCVGPILGTILMLVGSHVLIGILEFDLLRDRHAILGDERRAELLIENRVPSFRSQRRLDGVRQLIYASQNRGPCVLTVQNLLCCHFLPPSCLFRARCACVGYCSKMPRMSSSLMIK